LKDPYWQGLRDRFGTSSEQILNNVETMFRSLEFLYLLKGVLTSDGRYGGEMQLRLPESPIRKNSQKESQRSAGKDTEIKAGPFKILIT